MRCKMARSVAFFVLALVVASWCYAAEDRECTQSNPKLVTITFKEVPLAKALELLSKQGLNYVATKEVLDSAPPVTARFRNVPVMEAAKLIVRTAGLYYVIEPPMRIQVQH